MVKIKAIIFDMDGVLIDAKNWHYEALNRALALFGMEISRYEHLMNYDGLPTKKKLEMLTLERGFPTELHQLINDLKQKYTLEIVYSHCRPRFQHEYALSRFKLAGYRLVVASNSIRESVRVMLEQAALINYMEFYLSNEDVKVGKPDPEIYNKAMQMLGLSPQECLILEDNENGIKAAVASGAWLLKINEVGEVNYENIMSKILSIEGQT